MLPVLVSSRWSCICSGRDALWILLMPVADGLLKRNVVDRSAVLMLQATSRVSSITVDSRALLVLPLPAGFSRCTGAEGAAMFMLNEHIARLLCCC